MLVLSYLICCDYRIWVDFSTGSCAFPLCCVFLAELGLIPFNLELTFTFLSLWSVRTSHTPSLTHCISHTLVTDRVILLASVQHHSQGITLRPTARTPTPNGLRSNCDFLPRRSPWHVGGSNTINISGARRRAWWQVVSSHPILNIWISFMDSCTLLPQRCFSNREYVSISGNIFDLLSTHTYDGEGEVA